MNTNHTSRVSTESHAVALTADCAIFGFSGDALRVLLVRRAVEPFKGYWVLPGGAMQPHETLEDTATHLLSNLVNVENVPIHQVGTYSSLTRHPVRRVVTTTYFALVSPEDHDPIAREYLDKVMWCPMNKLPDLGYDHKTLLADAYEALKEELRQQPLAFHLLPDSFTLKEAQEVYESILDEELDRRNFRRKILSYDFLINTEEKKPGVKGGPELYRVDDAKLEEHLQ
ncbi:NUDIX hydrolase [Neolewinella aurantiaca]|uniref:NUDIX hydrolase n=1 Tax=Neolewinella aurantiaca TaxID=2602767 RepID=A0A5C7FUH2_9BACT|nr:NUDIX domain-containing protein [Neolewinella aurantiaca]TXF90237.1 NUDIX hydrolase [Neolewinella aurantiaca]